MSWRNEKTLYKRKCDLCSGDFLSIYPKETIFKIYCQQCWRSDKWSADIYAEEVDFSRPFFEQFKELYTEVPKFSLSNLNSVKSDYCNLNIDIKNCYLVFGSGYNEDCIYSNTLFKCRNVLDSNFTSKCEYSAYLIDCDSCYDTLFSQDSQNCINSMFLFDCHNCQNCLLSTNLRNKSFYIRNKKVDKETFKKVKADILSSNKKLQDALLEFKEMKINTMHKYMVGKNYIHSTGNNISDSRNIKNSYFILDSENLFNCVKSVKQKDASDGFGTSLGELTYDTMNADFCSNSKFVINGEYIAFSSYVVDGQNNSNLFACVGLRNKSYCILNKQYTKEQYEELIPKIIRHMNDMPYIDSKGKIYKYGEFFPSELSPFCYNETIAQEYFPLTKEEALKQGYKWKDKEERNYTIDIKTEDIPDSIKEVDETILGKVIECEHKGTCNEQCTEAFKIIAPELQLYQRMNLPLPHLCPNCRHYQRLKQRNPLKLWHRTCMCEKTTHTHQGKCEVEFETSYAPERPEIVYCEKCYQGEVY
ncbi:MAG: hypothetical protein WC629_02385 [Candidatus Paceibacterota bacterium]